MQKFAALSLEAKEHLFVQVLNTLQERHRAGECHGPLTLAHIRSQTAKGPGLQAADSVDDKDLIKTTAPEILVGSLPIDHRADLYAAGVLFYRVLSNQWPFEHQGDPAAIRAWHLTGSPALKPLTDAKVPGFMINILVRLMAKSPQDRFWSAWAVIEAINQHTFNRYQLVAPSAPWRNFLDGPCVGRERLLTEIMTWLGEKKLPTLPLCYSITAPAGMGKTRLIAELKHRAVLAGIGVIELAADRGASILPALTTQLHALLGNAQDIFDLTHLLPQKIWQARTQPIILCIDDAHQLDADATRWLMLVMGWLKNLGPLCNAQPLQLILAHEATDRDRQPLAWQNSWGVKTLALSPLTVADGKQYLAALGPPEDRIEALVPQLMDETKGQPWLVEEWVRIRLARGWLPSGAAPVLRATTGLGAWWAERTRDLTPAAQQAYTKVALTWRPLAPIEVGLLIGLDTTLPKTLLAQGLVSKNGNQQLRLANHALARWWNKTLSFEEKSAAHLQIARLLKSSLTSEELAYHLYKGGQGPAAAKAYLRAAATTAKEATLNYQRAHHLSRALKLGGSALAGHHNIMRELARLWLELGEPAKATKLMDRLKLTFGEEPLPSDWEICGQIALAQKDLVRAEMAFVQARKRALATNDTVGLIRNENNLGDIRLAAGDLEAARLIFEKSLASAQALAPRDQEHIPNNRYATVLTRLGRFAEALKFLEKQLCHPALPTSLPRTAEWLVLLADLTLTMKGWPQAKEILKKTVALAGGHPSPAWLITATGRLVQILTQLCEFSAALELACDRRWWLATSQNPQEILANELMLIRIQLRLGLLAEAEKTHANARKWQEMSGAGTLATQLLLAHSLILYERGQLTQAEQGLAEILHDTEKETGEVMAATNLLLANIALLQGNTARAAALIGDAVGSTRGLTHADRDFDMRVLLLTKKLAMKSSRTAGLAGEVARLIARAREDGLKDIVMEGWLAVGDWLSSQGREDAQTAYHDALAVLRDIISELKKEHGSAFLATPMVADLLRKTRQDPMLLLAGKEADRAVGTVAGPHTKPSAQAAEKPIPDHAAKLKRHLEREHLRAKKFAESLKMKDHELAQAHHKLKELEHRIKHLEHVPPAPAKIKRELAGNALATGNPGLQLAPGLTMRDYEKLVIQGTLAACENNKSHAAERLGITRATLHKKIKEYGCGK